MKLELLSDLWLNDAMTGQNTGKTVAIILGGIAGVAFLVICLLFARNLVKKRDGRCCFGHGYIYYGVKFFYSDFYTSLIIVMLMLYFAMLFCLYRLLTVEEDGLLWRQNCSWGDWYISFGWKRFVVNRLER